MFSLFDANDFVCMCMKKEVTIDGEGNAARWRHSSEKGWVGRLSTGTKRIL